MQLPRARRRSAARGEGLVIDLRDDAPRTSRDRRHITCRNRIPVSEESYWYELEARAANRDTSDAVSEEPTAVA
jgi:hypothetical protein